MVSSVAIEALLDARSTSYAYVYYATIAVNGVGLIASLSLRDYDHLLNSHVPRQMYTGGRGVDENAAFAAGDSEKGHPAEAFEAEKGQVADHRDNVSA